MASSAKTYLGIIVAVIIVGGGTLLLTRQGTSDGNDSSPIELIPEQSISHGHGLAVDVIDPNKLYIATHYGLFVLIDDKDLFRIGINTDDYMGFSLHPTDARISFSSGHPSDGGNIGFQKSVNGGFNWSKVSDGENGPIDFHAMAISPVNPNLIYGWYQGNIQRSSDQGESWEIVNSDLLPIQLVADSQDEDVVYAATQGSGVVVSRDKGVSWTILSPELGAGFTSAVAIQPENSKVLLTFGENLGGMGKSIDAGATWKKVNEPFNGDVVLHIAFSSVNPNIVYALTLENSIYKSTDAGETWTSIR